MAALDLSLPGLQLRSFLGLLGRRRWLIVPLGLLGGLVGTLTALMIPRYYRASTEVELKDVSLEGLPVSRPNEDPMEVKVENARFTLASATMLLKAARELKWQEFFATDPADAGLRSLLESARGRVDVYLVRSHRTPGASGIMGISYADKDPNRAADMANNLRNLWLQEQRRSILDNLTFSLEKANELMREAHDRWLEARQALEIWEQANRLDPVVVGTDGRPGSELYRRRETLAVAQAEDQVLLSQLQEREQALAQELDSLNPTVPRVVATAPPADGPEIQEELRAIALLEQILAMMTEEHPAYPARLAELEARRERVRAARAAAAAPIVEGEMENPARAPLAAERQRTRREKQEVERRVAERKNQLETLDKEIQRFPVVRGEHERLLQAVRDAQARDEEAQERRAQLHMQREFFNARQSWEVITEAYPPPAPNDPSTLLTVLIGLAAGLGTAVGLILLSEVLRISFRSVDEAERALAVPVLGAAAHLVTEAELLVARRRRLLFSTVGVGLLLALATVVGIFFVDESRLPSFLSRTLQQLFGP